MVQTMKAFVRTSAASQTVEMMEVAKPVVTDEEVLVQVKAFGVGIHDRYFIPQTVRFPYVIGSEGAGTIVVVGKDVTSFAAGDNVIMSTSMLAQGGSWAEYVAVPTRNLVKMSTNLNFAEAAALPVAGKTAMECLNALNLSAGETLFIAGASGAIGTIVIQMAKNNGIQVIASASQKNHAYMQSLGVDFAVDYRDTLWRQHVLNYKPAGVDAALAIQPGTAAQSIDVVRTKGKVITVSGDTTPSKRGIVVEQFQHQLTFQQSIGALMEQVEAEKIQIVIEREYPFNEALKALEKTETRHARGKLIVSIN